MPRIRHFRRGPELEHGPIHVRARPGQRAEGGEAIYGRPFVVDVEPPSPCLERLWDFGDCDVVVRAAFKLVRPVH
jgi:hypothetical protein